MIKKLLYQGADRTIKDNRQRTAIDLAAEKNKNNLVEMLSTKNNLNICIFRTPMEKLQKSNKNIYLFFLIHFFLAFIMINIIIPCNHWLK